jgi:hypothetical protein
MVDYPVQGFTRRMALLPSPLCLQKVVGPAAHEVFLAVKKYDSML